MGEIVRYLPDQKQISAASQTVDGADRAQNLPEPPPNNVLIVLQILIQIGLLSAE